MDEGELLPFPGIPLADATGSAARRRPGRPRKVERRPTVDDLAYFASVATDRVRHADADDVVAAVRGRADASEVLRRVREGIAVEAAVLEHERLEQQKRGLDVGQISSRRIEALTRLATLEVEALRLRAGTIDPRNEGMQRVFRAWVGDVRDAAVATMAPEALDAFFTLLETRLQTWEDRAEALLR
ncbi:MAG: hypothetical protein HYZ29_16030 [Myxococcales bacterium]|nr:hypothetical protein [Myxococcales bacterium]